MHFVGEEDGEGGEGNPLGDLGGNDSHLRQAGYSWVHRCAPRRAKLKEQLKRQKAAAWALNSLGQGLPGIALGTLWSDGASFLGLHLLR